MSVEAVVFDVDDTLSDWSMTIETALATIVAESPDADAIATTRAAIRQIVCTERGGCVVERAHWRLFRPDPPWRDILGDHQLVPSLELAFQKAATPVIQTMAYADTHVLADLATVYRLGVLTNNPYGKIVLEGYDLARHFHDIVMMDDDSPFQKPHIRAFEEACRALGASPEQTVMVGDSIACDVEGALAAGMTAVWIDRFGDEYDLGPTCTASNRW